MKAINALKLIAVVILITLTGCVGTKAGAYKVFAEDLQRLEGTQFNSAYVWFVGHLSEQKPVAKKHLKNGNEIRIYKFAKKRNQDCMVFIEVNPGKEIIQEATSKGVDCWRPY